MPASNDSSKKRPRPVGRGPCFPSSGHDPIPGITKGRLNHQPLNRKDRAALPCAMDRSPFLRNYILFYTHLPPLSRANFTLLGKNRKKGVVFSQIFGIISVLHIHREEPYAETRERVLPGGGGAGRQGDHPRGESHGPGEQAGGHHRPQRRRQEHPGPAHRGHRNPHGGAHLFQGRGHHGPGHHRPGPAGHRLCLSDAGPVQGHPGEGFDPHRLRQAAEHRRGLRVSVRRGPVRPGLYRPGGERLIVRRGAQAHRDRHGPGPGGGPVRLRRARGGHRSVELPESH